jgi:hypothetical protein
MCLQSKCASHADANELLRTVGPKKQTFVSTIDFAQGRKAAQEVVQFKCFCRRCLLQKFGQRREWDAFDCHRVLFADVVLAED